MRDKLNSVIEKYNQLSEQLTDQEVISNPHKLAVIAKEHRSLEELAKKAELYLKSEIELAEANEMAQGDDEEMREMAQEEISNLNSFDLSCLCLMPLTLLGLVVSPFACRRAVKSALAAADFAIFSFVSLIFSSCSSVAPRSFNCLVNSLEPPAAAAVRPVKPTLKFSAA